MSFFNRQGWRRALLSAAVLVAVGAVCVSCGAAEKPSALVGQWVFADGYSGSKTVGKSVEMFSDGTGVVDGASMTWKVESKRLMILTSNVGIACDYKVSGYELVLTYDEENSATFVKKGSLEEYKKKKAEEKKREAERAEKEAEARFGKISTYFTDTRNGQKYRVVKIGGKSWMAENLNYQTGNSWCYENDNSNCEKYGRLYDWKTATTVCPSGWHLPSRVEWGELAKAIGGTGDYGAGGTAGTKLKSTYGWDENGNGTDEFGFSALPGGYRGTGGSFGNVGYDGGWWAATELGSGGAYYRDMHYNYGSVGEDIDVVSRGFSVRCFGD